MSKQLYQANRFTDTVQR